MHPRNLGLRFGRDERVFQVTKSGLSGAIQYDRRDDIGEWGTIYRLGMWDRWVTLS
jgi:hypothetical protein